jgi:hypothetical protein
MSASQKIALDAFGLFKKNILPAKMAETHNNGDLLLKQVQKIKGRVPDSVPELAAALKEAATQIAAKLEWEILPKKLTSNPNQPENPHTLPDGVRTQQGKDVDAKAAEDAAQKLAGEQINNLIDSFAPPSKRGGIAHAVKDSEQKILRAHVEKERARGVKNKEIFPVIRDYVERKYREIELKIEQL